MNFNIASSVMKRTLQRAVALVDDSKKETILGHLLMNGDAGSLTVTVNGFDAEVRLGVDCDPGGKFTRTFPAKKTNDICRTLPADCDISLALEDAKVSRLSCGNSNFTLSTVDASEFPSMHDMNMEPSASLTIDYDSFHGLIAGTGFSMAVADVRPMLNGLLFDFGKNMLRVVATDGHRLAYFKKEMDFKGDKLQVIVPRKIVERLDRIISKDNGDITLSASDRYMRLEQDGVSLICRLIEGQYPDYEKVIPKVGSNIGLVVDRQELLGSISRVGSLVSSESTAAAKMKVGDGKIVMSSRSVLGEEANDEIKVDYGGDGVEINFNISYLKVALENITGDNVRFELRDSVSSFMVLPEDNDNQKYVIMPMRV